MGAKGEGGRTGRNKLEGGGRETEEGGVCVAYLTKNPREHSSIYLTKLQLKTVSACII